MNDQKVGIFKSLPCTHTVAYCVCDTIIAVQKKDLNTSNRELMNLLALVCSFVNWITRIVRFSQTWMKYLDTVRNSQRNNSLDFGGKPDHHMDAGLFEKEIGPVSALFVMMPQIMHRKWSKRAGSLYLFFVKTKNRRLAYEGDLFSLLNPDSAGGF